MRFPDLADDWIVDLSAGKEGVIVPVANVVFRAEDHSPGQNVVALVWATEELE
jgi:hypothetical protein